MFSFDFFVVQCMIMILNFCSFSFSRVIPFFNGKIHISVLFYFIPLTVPRGTWILIPQPGIEPMPLQWKHRVLNTEQPGNSPCSVWNPPLQVVISFSCPQPVTVSPCAVTLQRETRGAQRPGHLSPSGSRTSGQREARLKGASWTTFPFTAPARRQPTGETDARLIRRNLSWGLNMKVQSSSTKSSAV